MTTSPVLTLKDVHGYIGTSHILQGVSLSVPPGEITMLLGRNGVGKTTTIRAILGFIRSTGAVDYQGQDLAKLKSYQIIRKGIGYVPENRDVFTGLTVKQNLDIATTPKTKGNFDLVYDLFPELLQRTKQTAGSLSGGQQQMLAIGRALINDNKLLLIDEPTKGLSPRLVTDVVVAIERAKAHSSILMVEQNLAVASRLADNIAVMDHGEIVKAGKATDFITEGGDLGNLLQIVEGESE